MKPNSPEKIERNILLLSFVMSSFFAAIELFAAIGSRSNSMLMDAAYDATELVVIALTLFLTPLFHKPLSERHPFGYAQVESIFIAIKNLMMVSVTFGLLGDTISVMLAGGNQVDSSFVAIFQLVLGCISFVVLGVMQRKNRAISSPIIATEIYGWRIDTYYSFGMSGAFFLATLLKNTALSPILPYFDQIVAIVIVIFMIPQALKMLIASLRNMLLFSPDSTTVDAIKEIAGTVLAPYGYLLLSCDVYKTGRILWADLYIATEQDCLRVEEFTSANQQMQAALREALVDCRSELILQSLPKPEPSECDLAANE